MRSLLSCLVMLTSLSCASTGGSADEAHFSREVGRGTAQEVLEKTQIVLLQHQFEIDQVTDPPAIYLRTRWRDRYPFEDEIARGVDEAQVRATVRGQPRRAGGLTLYTVHITIEQRVRTPFMQDWITHTVTPRAEAYAARIAGDLERHLNVGVHRE